MSAVQRLSGVSYGEEAPHGANIFLFCRVVKEVFVSAALAEREAMDERTPLLFFFNLFTSKAYPRARKWTPALPS